MPDGLTMELSRNYDRSRFSPEVLREAATTLFAGLKGEPGGTMKVTVGEDEWTHDTEEAFFADYRRSSGQAFFRRYILDVDSDQAHKLLVQCIDDWSVVTVTAPSRTRIHKTFEVFDRNVDSARLPEPSQPPEEPEPPPIVFIGHGQSPAWRDLKDHLHEKHGFNVEAYEVGERAGHAIRDILQDMLQRSSFAVLVMTGEDETAEGGVRARQNVIHEAGLFQGRLGFNRAIVLLEEGTEAFSNIQGIDQIRFTAGNIKETFGDVIATLRREFGSGAA